MAAEVVQQVAEAALVSPELVVAEAVRLVVVAAVVVEQARALRARVWQRARPEVVVALLLWSRIRYS